MSYVIDEETNEVEVKAAADLSNTIEVEECVASTTQRPQRTRFLIARLLGWELVGDDEVTQDEDIIHFALLASVEPILNYSEALENKQWKSSIVENLQVIERNNTWELVNIVVTVFTELI